MPALISSVEIGSIAEELEIQSGDKLVSIDNHIVTDMIDYNFCCKTELLTIQIEKQNGDIEEIEIEKDFDEDLGLIFESAVFDKIKPCLNKCIFCFVDQQPKGLRDTLYVKDDDYRLSYLQGTYITLTNLTQKDRQRISNEHLGPFYISVHTTNPDLRVKMLRNPKAANIIDELNWLKDNEIPFHAQIVLCPGYNDGKELKRTLTDLSGFGEFLLSVAIVPVGITCYREGDLLKPVTKDIACETICIASKYDKVCCSDEFFLLAGQDIPNTEYYGNFGQLSDGVGAIRLLLDNFKQYELPASISQNIHITFATSFAAKYAIDMIAKELNKISNLSVNVAPVKSNYWGDGITVAGLITSGDLINTVKDITSEYVVISGVMFKQYSETFLDGKTLDDVKNITKKQFIVIKEQYDLKELIDFINSL